MSKVLYLIDESRLAKLLREEQKLKLLENGGVDNWEWYDESLFHPDEGKTLNDIEDISDEEIIKNYKDA